MENDVGTFDQKRSLHRALDMTREPMISDVMCSVTYHRVSSRACRYCPSSLSEVEASRTAAGKQAAKQAQLEKQLEAALLDKTRLQELDSGTCTWSFSACNFFFLCSLCGGALMGSNFAFPVLVGVSKRTAIS